MSRSSQPCSSRLRSRHRRAPLSGVALLVLLAFTSACGDSSPTTPSNAPDLTGSWSGTGSDSSGSGTVSVTFAQAGSSLTGTARLVTNGISGNGSVTGTLSGTTLSFTLSIPIGGFASPFSACSSTLSGTAKNVTSTRIEGTYAGSNSCTGSYSNGSVTLTKQ